MSAQPSSNIHRAPGSTTATLRVGAHIAERGIRAILGVELGEVLRACGAFEWVTLTYLTWLLAVGSFFHRNLPAAPAFFLVHAALFLTIPMLAWLANRWPTPSMRFLRHFYFLPLWLFLFEELNNLVHLIFPRWFDSWLIHFDHAIFRVYPWDWLGQFSSPALNDVMQFGYMTYFLALIVLPAILYARKERRAFWTVLTAMALAHYAVYVIAVLLPIESPFHAFPALQSAPLRGGAVTHMVELIERFFRVRGAAFPSAHVAGAFAALLGAWHFRRWLFWIHLPLFVLMVISTVYGRYHYAGDGLAGLLVGAVAYCAAQRFMLRSGAIPPEHT